MADNQLLSALNFLLTAPGNYGRGALLKAMGPVRPGPDPGWSATGEEFLRAMGNENPSGLASFATEVGLDPLNLLPIAGAVRGMGKLKGVRDMNALRAAMIKEGAVPGEFAGKLLQDAAGEPQMVMTPEFLRRGAGSSAELKPAYMIADRPYNAGGNVSKAEAMNLADQVTGTRTRNEGGIDDAFGSYIDKVHGEPDYIGDAAGDLDDDAIENLMEKYPFLAMSDVENAGQMMRADLQSRYDAARNLGFGNEIPRMEVGDLEHADLEDLVKLMREGGIDVDDIVPPEITRDFTRSGIAKKNLHETFGGGDTASGARALYDITSAAPRPPQTGNPFEGNLHNIIPGHFESKFQAGMPMHDTLSRTGYDALLGGNTWREGAPAAIPIGPPVAQPLYRKLLEMGNSREQLATAGRGWARREQLAQSGDPLSKLTLQAQMRRAGADPNTTAPLNWVKNLRAKGQRDQDFLDRELRRLQAQLDILDPKRAYLPQVSPKKQKEVPAMRDAKRLLLVLLGLHTARERSEQ